eukprot:GFKZ01009927.1.p1 GENE.GFKZ01009927.1~~GFKZ01009927.1.p1  ORF type:complete len:540 (-),score=73.49 GFKZ01009927.1:171-1790(-)
MFDLPCDRIPDYGLFPGASSPNLHYDPSSSDPLKDVTAEEIFPNGIDSVFSNHEKDHDFLSPFQDFDANKPEVNVDAEIQAECEALASCFSDRQEKDHVTLLPPGQTAPSEISGEFNPGVDGNDIGLDFGTIDGESDNPEEAIEEAPSEHGMQQATLEDGVCSGLKAAQPQELQAELKRERTAILTTAEHFGNNSGAVLDTIPLNTPNLDQDRDEEPVTIQLPTNFLSGECSGVDRRGESNEADEIREGGFTNKRKASVTSSENRNGGSLATGEDFSPLQANRITDEEMGTHDIQASGGESFAFLDSFLDEPVGKELEHGTDTGLIVESKPGHVGPVAHGQDRVAGDSMPLTDRKTTTMSNGKQGAATGRVASAEAGHRGQELQGQGERRQKKKRTRVEDLDPTEVYVCPVADCRKKFAKKYNLKIHERRHRGDLPFICPKCSKKFMWQSSFERHLRVHSSREAGYMGRARREIERKGGSGEKRSSLIEIERICNSVSSVSLHGHLLTVNHLEPGSAMVAGSLAILNGVRREEYGRLFE